MPKKHYRGIDKARNENYNVVIIDSAGRLQNKFNLIEELKKIKNVISKKIENDNLETRKEAMEKNVEAFQEALNQNIEKNFGYFQ